MKFNNVGPTKEFDTKSRLPLYLLAVVVAAILGFVLLVAGNLSIILLAVLIKYWIYGIIVFVILIIIKVKRARKKKNENRSK